MELKPSDGLWCFRVMQALKLVGDKSEALINYKKHLLSCSSIYWRKGKDLARMNGDGDAINNRAYFVNIKN